MSDKTLLTDEELGMLLSLYSLKTMGKDSHLNDAPPQALANNMKRGLIISKLSADGITYTISQKGINVVCGGYQMHRPLEVAMSVVKDGIHDHPKTGDELFARWLENHKSMIKKSLVKIKGNSRLETLRTYYYRNILL